MSEMETSSGSKLAANLVPNTVTMLSFKLRAPCVWMTVLRPAEPLWLVQIKRTSVEISAYAWDEKHSLCLGLVSCLLYVVVLKYNQYQSVLSALW